MGVALAVWELSTAIGCELSKKRDGEMPSASVLKLDSELLKAEKLNSVQLLTNSYLISTANTAQSKPTSKGSLCSLDLYLGFRM